MRRTALIGIALVVCLRALGAPKLEARVILAWSIQELLDKSDLVVIATPAATVDTNEQIDLPGIKQVTPDNKTIGIPAIGVETKFGIVGVLKGDKSLKEFTLHHYREKELSKTGINGSSLLFFNPGEKGEFLVFLVREADGRCAPTSGQTDPALYSVRSLGPAHGIQLEVIPSGEPKGKR